MKRKTYTSNEVKDRWNREHYDRVAITVPKGAREEIQAAAKARGQSVSAYIRSLIIRDNAEKPETTRNLRGGGVVDNWKRMQRAALEKLGIV